MKNIAAAFGLAVTVALLSGCQTMGQKESIGTFVGAAVGGVLGNQIGGGRGRVIATAIGITAGSIIGSQIGAALDERDRLAMENSTQRALRTGRAQRWESDHNRGVSGTVRVVETIERPISVEIPVLKERVKETPPLDFIRGDYRSTASVNVRGGPSTQYVVIDSLKPNQTTHVIGQVKNKNWYMISQGGVGTGFVATRLLQPVPAGAVAQQASTITPAGSVASATIEGSSTCRVVQQTVTLSTGATRSEEVRACQSSDGDWVIS